MRKSIRKERIEEIYTAAIQLFAQKGFKNASLNEIAKKINITKPALYFYFKSKEDLFFSLFEDKLKNLFLIWQNIFDSNQTPILKLKKLIKKFIDFGIKNQDFFILLLKTEHISSLNFKHKNIRKKIQKQMLNVLEKLKNLINECIDAGYLRKENPYFLAFSLKGILNQSLFNYILFKTLKNNKELIPDPDKILLLFLSGAGTEKAKEVLK